MFNISSLDEMDYAIDLIKQAYNYNEEYLENKGKGRSARHDKRFDFWKGLLEVAKEKNVDFQNLSPSIYHWIGKGGGKSGISFNFVILNKYSEIEVYLDKRDKEVNKKRFDFLMQHKKDIEDIFEDSLIWERLDSKRACRIGYKFENVGLKDKDSWKDLQQKLVVKMMKLEKAFEKFIDDLE